MMSEQTSPSITFMLQYTEANAQYVDYTNRDEAVELDNNIALDQSTKDVEGLSEAQIAAIKESVPEQGLDFENYINYMNRSYATEKQDEKVTAIFNQDTNYLSVDQVANLKSNLTEAYDHGSLLWQGVISFDNAFLAKEGLYDVETGKVDQQAIKNVVREAMPNLISQEGLDSSAFWWGNIHLNTDNVHVHFGLAEKKSARKRFFYEPRGRWEYRGNFSQKTIKQLKSQVLNGLLNEQTKEQHLRQEQILANLKTNLIQDVFKPEKITQSAEKNFLEQAFSHLPQDKKWRYGSHAKDFAVSKFFLDKYLDSFFDHDGKELYTSYMAETREFLELYQQSYTSSETGSYERMRKVDGVTNRQVVDKQAFQLEKFVQKREQELRERLANRILKQFKESEPQFSGKALEPNLNHFSERNRELILSQYPKASLLKPKDSWKKLGYNVSEDSQPIKVLRPKYQAYDANGKGIGKPDFISFDYYDISQVTYSLTNKTMTVKELDVFSEDELSELITRAKTKESKSEREIKELGLYRYALKLRGYQEEQARLQVMGGLLKKIKPTPNNETYLKFKQKEIRERLELTKLGLTPSYKLSDKDKSRKAALENAYPNARQLPIEKATRQNLQTPKNRLHQEINLVKQLRDPALINIVADKPMERQQYLEKLEATAAVLSIKESIHTNNKIIKTTQTEEEKKAFRRENAQYFKQLQGLYAVLEDKEVDQSGARTQSQTQAPSIRRTVNSQLETKKLQQRTTMQQRQSSFQATSHFISGLSKSLKASAREEERAYKTKRRSDIRDEEERQER